MKETAGTAPAIVCAMYYKLPLYLSLTLTCTKCKDHFKTKKIGSDRSRYLEIGALALILCWARLC